MNQLVYSPFGALNQLHRELARVFDEPYGGSGETDYEVSSWVPQVDIKEDANAFSVSVDVPGVSPQDVDVTLDRNLLTIRGERNTENEAEEGGYKRRERISGRFVRQFTLPDTADAEGIKARVENGVLQLTIPKGEKHKPRQIAVE